jgi:hypothetical protein
MILSGVGAERVLKACISVVTSVGGDGDSVVLMEDSEDALEILVLRKAPELVVAVTVGASDDGGDLLWESQGKHKKRGVQVEKPWRNAPRKEAPRSPGMLCKIR